MAITVGIKCLICLVGKSLVSGDQIKQILMDLAVKSQVGPKSSSRSGTEK
jgi:hypothetical protein